MNRFHYSLGLMLLSISIALTCGCQKQPLVESQLMKMDRAAIPAPPDFTSPMNKDAPATEQEDVDVTAPHGGVQQARGGAAPGDYAGQRYRL